MLQTKPINRRGKQTCMQRGSSIFGLASLPFPEHVHASCTRERRFISNLVVNPKRKLQSTGWRSRDRHKKAGWKVRRRREEVISGLGSLDINPSPPRHGDSNARCARFSDSNLTFSFIPTIERDIRPKIFSLKVRSWKGSACDCASAADGKWQTHLSSCAVNINKSPARRLH